MSRKKKLKILIPLVIAFFLGAYAKHRFIDGKYVVTGRLRNQQVDEVSGLAPSLVNNDVYYVNNDSGDTSRFFAINPQGELLSTIYYNWELRPGLNIHDCEDIATGPGPEKGKSYVYIADIGDNRSNRVCINIYRVRDRASFATQQRADVRAVTLNLKYPDGPKDAEAFMIDPIDRLMYIVTKRRDSVGVYTTPLKISDGDTVTLTRQCRLFFSGIKPFKWITGGSISADGQHILLKSYQNVYYWHRRQNEPVWQALKREPDSKPSYHQEKLGEAIGFTHDGKGYYTTSEGVHAPIYFYRTPGTFGL